MVGNGQTRLLMQALLEEMSETINAATKAARNAGLLQDQSQFNQACQGIQSDGVALVLPSQRLDPFHDQLTFLKHLQSGAALQGLSAKPHTNHEQLIWLELT